MCALCIRILAELLRVSAGWTNSKDCRDFINLRRVARVVPIATLPGPNRV
jgi:hypothetical protein